MSQSVPVMVNTFLAGADLSGSKNRFAKLSADNTVAVATAHGDSVVGVIDDVPYNAVGAQVAVRMEGTVMITASAAIAAGAKLVPTTGGKAVTAASGNTYHAIAIQAATADGDLIECFLVKGVTP